jgi:CheY-like chemotaxis protein/signal transduction histidine kinase/HAMP domain-containing protein
MFWKLFIPFAVVLAISALAAAWFLPLLIQRNAERDAIEAGQETVRQFKALRKYYTDNVVEKVRTRTDLKVNFDHADKADTVPLPATMILDMSAMLKESGTTLKLYSPYPFPNRRDRVIDQFGQDAWTFLKNNPDRVFTRVEQVEGRTSVRVAIADRMSAQACVSCHNALPSSPRTDWKLGDVRGVLEVNSSRQLDTGERVAIQVLVVFGLMMLLLAGLLRFLYQRSIARPLMVAVDAARTLTQGSVDKVADAEAIADGKLDRELTRARMPDIDQNELGGDEAGDLLRSVLGMARAQQALDQAFRKMTASLRQARDAEAQRDWLTSGQNELNRLMRGAQEPQEFGAAVLTFLAERIGAAVGVLYLHDADAGDFYYCAGHALPLDKAPARVAWGEGLLGQALQERRMMEFDDVPAGYLPVASPLGRADPCSIVVLPLRHGDNIVGAVELGTFRKPEERERAFLELVQEGIAIGFEVNLARKHSAALLHETEQQGEELRVQQEELEQTNAELEERGDELWRKAQELQKVSAFKSEFMANMSHELRTPLNSMLILSGLLKDNKAGNLDARQVEYANTINSAGKDLLTLINDILDLAKVEAGQVEFQLAEESLAGLCQTLRDLFQPAAEQKGLRFDTEIAAGVGDLAVMDLQRTQQVLKNLIGNAIKFTDAGHVTLRISAAPHDNPLGTGALAFAVSDTGVGVAAEKCDVIFEAFKQADGGISRHYGGTGLGLSISLQLARRMGGELTLDSEVGRGSTFTLYLPHDAEPTAIVPAAREAVPGPAVPDDRARLRPHDRSILIIEDDLSFARILVDTVRGRGFGAIVAIDGETGLALALEYRPTAILLDVMLPRMDGWSVLRGLKADQRTSAIPVHIVTCLEERSKALGLGAVDLLTKPVSNEQLQAVLASIEGGTGSGPRKLLIVEDDEVESASLVALLSAPDVEITVAHSGAAGIAQLDETQFDCVVLDLGLGDMPGSDVLAHVRRSGAGRQVPVIVHSGRSLSAEQERELHRHADSIIVKGGVSPQRLLDEVTLFLHMVESGLPRQTAVAGPAGPPSQHDAALENKKVLIVDDDMRNVFSLSSLLADQGMQLLEADNGKEALARLDENPDIDLVLMDVMMPEMDGYEAMRRIRADARWSALPVIAMTAKAMQGDDQKCLEAGASDYIAKPLDTARLLSMLRVWSGG